MKHYCAEPERYHRQGFPEAIYGPGKTIKQIINIAKELIKGGGPVIITRSDEKTFKAVKKSFPSSIFYSIAGIIHVISSPKKNPVNNQADTDKFICVITAGTSDVPVAEEAATTAEILGAKVERVYDVGVAGVHRLLNRQELLCRASCVIVCAGMEGALASVVGGIVSCPVIGVPTSIGYGVSFGGVSALLTMLNSCAANVSVVNIDDGFGAGVIASLMVKN